MLLRRMGRYTEAVSEFERAHDLDPISRLSGANLAHTYWLAGDLDRAIEIQQKLSALYPEVDWAHLELAGFYAHKGLFDQAFDELELVKSPIRQLALAGYIHALAGDTAEALKSVEEVESSADPSAFQKDWFTARIYAGLGDDDEAFRRVERLDPQFAMIVMELPFLAPFRDNPRYKALLRRVGL